MAAKTRRVVVVTGATGGVGRATARGFARRGDAVAVLARGAAGLDAVAAEIRDAGAPVLALPVDTADADAVEDAASRAEAELGPIDVWVNNAFTSVFAPFTEIGPAEFRRVTEVTYLGYVNGTRAALARMKPRDRGVVVQVGSALAHRSVPLQSAYCGAKHAILGFHESVRCELLHDRSGVRVTMVQLPALNTPQFDWVRSRLPYRPQPVPPIYQPEVAAEAVVHAAGRPGRREHWVGGSTVATLLANRLAPGLLDRYLAKTGYGAQQTAWPQPEDAPVNLWRPADQDDDFGAHGRFDRESAEHAPLDWVRRHRAPIAAVTAATAAVAGLAARLGRR